MQEWKKDHPGVPYKGYKATLPGMKGKVIRKKIKVFLSLLDGKKVTMFFNPEDTVFTFMTDVGQQLGWETAQIKLIFGGKMISQVAKKPRSTLMTSYGI